MKHFSSPSSFAVIVLFTASRLNQLQSYKASTFFSFNKGHINRMLTVATIAPLDHHNQRRTFLALIGSS